MKIGIVSQSYYPRPGGVTEVVHHTARELRLLGHEVRIVTTHYRGAEQPDPDVIRIGRNVLVPMNGAWVNMTVGADLSGELRRIFARERFDVIHTHCPLVPTLPLMTIGVAPPEQRLVGTFHAAADRNLAYALFRAPLDRRAARLDARMAVSEAARAFASKYFPGAYEIVPNGIDCARFRPDLEPIARLRDGRFTILFVGRLDRRKGLSYLCRALPRIARELGGAVRLVIVSDRGVRRFLCPRPIDRRGAEILWTGPVTREELPRYYASADVFCSPATGQESFGIVLLEAMATRTAVVASDIPGYRTIVEHDRNGVLVPPRDVDALARMIVDLARDDARRTRLAREGRRTAERYDWPIVARRLDEIYRRVAGASEAARREAPGRYAGRA